MKSLKDYIAQVLAEDSNMPVATDSTSPLSKPAKKVKTPKQYDQVNDEISPDTFERPNKSQKPGK